MTFQALVPNEVSADRLTRGEWFQLGWGFLWRGFVITALSGVVGGTSGFVIGFVGATICVALGVPRESYEPSLKVIAGALGLVGGLFLFVVYLRWLLRARFGALRLALLRTASLPSEIR